MHHKIIFTIGLPLKLSEIWCFIKFSTLRIYKILRFQCVNLLELNYFVLTNYWKIKMKLNHHLFRQSLNAAFTLMQINSHYWMHIELRLNVPMFSIRFDVWRRQFTFWCQFNLNYISVLKRLSMIRFIINSS